nr:MAG TPA: YopX protein [Caudoviricetes sp.]
MIPKYRAWYKEWKEMGRVGGIRFDLDGSVSVVLFKGNYLDVSGPREKIILMQSTGLKDKNGKEVFVGDIIKCTRGCPHEVYLEKEYGGKYIGGMPAVYLKGIREGYAWTGAEEILGNIYEKPELLEVVE